MAEVAWGTEGSSVASFSAIAPGVGAAIMSSARPWRIRCLAWSARTRRPRRHQASAIRAAATTAPIQMRTGIMASGPQLALAHRLRCEPFLQLRIEKIAYANVHVLQRFGVRENSDHAHAGGAGRGDAGGRILKNDAVAGSHPETRPRGQINVRCGLGVAHLAAVGDYLKPAAQVGPVQDESHVSRF